MSMEQQMGELIGAVKGLEREVTRVHDRFDRTDRRLDKHDNRIRGVERFRYWIGGGIAVLGSVWAGFKHLGS